MPMTTMMMLLLLAAVFESLLHILFFEPNDFPSSTVIIVGSSSMSWLVAHPSIFRMLMKGKFDAYTANIYSGNWDTSKKCKSYKYLL